MIDCIECKGDGSQIKSLNDHIGETCQYGNDDGDGEESASKRAVLILILVPQQLCGFKEVAHLNEAGNIFEDLHGNDCN